MKLAAYLKSKKITGAAFAPLIGLSEGMVSLYLNDKSYPPKDVARRIFDATEGAVTPNDFADVEPQTEAVQ